MNPILFCEQCHTNRPVHGEMTCPRCHGPLIPLDAELHIPCTKAERALIQFMIKSRAQGENQSTFIRDAIKRHAAALLQENPKIQLPADLHALIEVC